MKRIIVFAFGLFTISLAFLSSCYYDAEEVLYVGDSNCDTTNIDFQTTIKPIIENNCATSGCHVSGTGRKMLTSDQDIMDIVNDGRLEDRVIKRRDMPPVQPLSSCEITSIKLWLAKSTTAN